MRLRKPPGRAGRPWLTQRLAVARRGADVLEQKRRGLLRDAWLRRALLIGGQRSFELAVFYVPEPANVRLEWRRPLGLTYASDADVRLPPTPDLVAPGGTAALPVAAGAFGRAVEAGARFAATRSALDRLDAELAATARRLRALERRWIPAYEQALAALALELDENEREDALRGRWFAERRGVQGAARASGQSTTP
jgi:V/A-type H+-transporting ATPase subunit D